MSARSLRRWAREDAAERPRGRPRTSAERRSAAAQLVAGAWERQGTSSGVRPVAAELAGAVPNWLVRQCLREIKSLHRGRRRAHQVEHRLSVEVRRRDVMWSMDGVHLARLPDGGAVEGQVVRETATPKILGAQIGAPAEGDDVIRLLERVALERGRLPLVLVTDNGSIYTCATVETWLAQHGVVHLLSLPHTPRHNPWVERTHREIKDETELGRGVVVHSVGEVRERVEQARCLLDGVRLRACLGFRTATEADADLATWYDENTRERFLTAVCRRLAQALPGLDSMRAERKARREAIYAAMEEFELARRTRGGR